MATLSCTAGYLCDNGRKNLDNLTFLMNQPEDSRQNIFFCWRRRKTAQKNPRKKSKCSIINAVMHVRWQEVEVEWNTKPEVSLKVHWLNERNLNFLGVKSTRVFASSKEKEKKLLWGKLLLLKRRARGFYIACFKRRWQKLENFSYLRCGNFNPQKSPFQSTCMNVSVLIRLVCSTW